MPGLIEQALTEESSPDEAVEDVLEFTRNWAGFHFPRMLMALERIQRRVMSDKGLRLGSYSFYAASVESLFLPSSVAALEEYGIPLQIALKLGEVLDLNLPLDDVLAALQSVDLTRVPLDEFELELIAQTLATL